MSFYSFEGFICLHIGKNHVEEDGYSHKENNPNPHRDEWLGCRWSILGRLHGCRFQIGVSVSGWRVIHVGPEKELRWIMLQFLILVWIENENSRYFIVCFIVEISNRKVFFIPEEVEVVAVGSSKTTGQCQVFPLHYIDSTIIQGLRKYSDPLPSKVEILQYKKYSNTGKNKKQKPKQRKPTTYYYLILLN